MPVDEPPGHLRSSGRTTGEVRKASLEDLRGVPERLVAYHDFIARHAGKVLLGALVVAAVSAWLSSRLDLRTNFAELLPSKDPAVEELRRTGARIGGTQVLQVAVESPDREVNLAFAGELVARLRRQSKELVLSASYDVREERRFFESHKWLYADLASLEEARDSLRAAIDHAKNPMIVDLVGGDEKPEQVLERLKAKASVLDQFPTGFFEADGGAGLRECGAAAA